MTRPEAEETGMIRSLVSFVGVALISPLGAVGVELEAFRNLVDGFREVRSTQHSGNYLCFTGGRERSSWEYADGSGAYVEWLSEAMPEKFRGQRVTFVIPCGLGGKGATVLGIPHSISVNGEHAVTIHAGVKRSRLWRKEGCIAYFKLVRVDEFGDAFGILLLSVPSEMLTASRPAVLRVTGTTNPSQKGSWFMLTHYEETVKYVTSYGSLKKFLTSTPATVMDTGPPGGEPGSMCLTGNSPDPKRNLDTGGSYTYRIPSSSYEIFPYEADTSLPRVAEINRPDMFQQGRSDRGGSAGWLQFQKGSLMAGLEEYVAWPMQFRGGAEPSRADLKLVFYEVLMDFKRDYLITDVDIYPVARNIKRVVLLARSENGPLVWIGDLKMPRGHIGPNISFHSLCSPARYLKICIEFFRGDRAPEWKPFGIREIRVWGKRIEGKKPQTRGFIWRGGRVVQREPKIQLQKISGPLVIPEPHQMSLNKGRFRVRNSTRLFVSGRKHASSTAKQILKEFKQRFGLELRLVDTSAVKLPDERAKWPTFFRNSIIVGDVESSVPARYFCERAGPQVTPTDPGPQGYVLSVTPQLVSICGSDEQGAYYGVQTLMQLLEKDRKGRCSIPAVRIRDFPYVKSRADNFHPFDDYTRNASEEWCRRALRRLARWKANVGAASTFGSRVGHRPEVSKKMVEISREYFVKIRPWIDLTGRQTPYERRLYSDNAVELEPGETIKRMEDKYTRYRFRGAYLLCPSNEELYEIFETQVKLWASYCDDLYINVGYQRHLLGSENGSRWNVCSRCRARNMNGVELFVDFIKRIRAICQKYGKLPAFRDSIFACASRVKGLGTSEQLLSAIPKDVGLIYDQDTHNRGYSLQWLLKKKRSLGLEFVVAWGWRLHPEVISALEERNPLDGTWLFCDGQGPTFDLLSYETAWSPGNPPASSPKMALKRANAIIQSVIQEGSPLPSWRESARFFKVNLRPLCNMSHIDPVAWDGKDWMDRGPNYDLSLLPTGNVVLAGVPFDVINPASNDGRSVVAISCLPELERREGIPRQVTIKIGRKAASLLILRTGFMINPIIFQARWNQHLYYAHVEFPPVYKIIYEDGSYVGERFWNGNLRLWGGAWDASRASVLSDPYTFPSAYLRPAWLGYMPSGDNASLYMWEWVNPYPEKKISRIEVSLNFPSWDADWTEVVFAITGTKVTAEDIEHWRAEKSARPPLPRLLPTSPPPNAFPLIDLSKGELEARGEGVYRYATEGRELCTIIVPDNIVPYHESKHYYNVSVADIFSEKSFQHLSWRTDKPNKPLEIQLREPTTLTAIAIRTRFPGLFQFGNIMSPSDFRTDYRCQVSSDGRRWVTVAENSNVGGNDGTYYYTGVPYPVRAVRLYASGGTSPEARGYGIHHRAYPGISYFQLFVSDH